MKIQKQIFSFLLALSVFWGTMSNYLITLSFQINSNYIANTLCVNKGNPNSDCCGKCFLKKELQQNNTSDQPNKTIPLKLVTLNWIFMSPLPYQYFSGNETPLYSSFGNLYCFRYHYQGFTPPWQA